AGLSVSTCTLVSAIKISGLRANMRAVIEVMSTTIRMIIQRRLLIACQTSPRRTPSSTRFGGPYAEPFPSNGRFTGSALETFEISSNAWTSSDEASCAFFLASISISWLELKLKFSLRNNANRQARYRRHDAANEAAEKSLGARHRHVNDVVGY